MGQARIISGGAEGLYAVELDFGQATKTANLARLAAQLAALAPQITTAEGYVTVGDVLEDVARAQVQAAIDAYVAATRSVPVDPAAVKVALDAYTKAQKDLLAEQTKNAPDRLKLQLLKSQRAAAQKLQAYWQALVLVETRPAWCADLTEDATGTVATVDIPGESALCIVAPAAPAPTAADGALVAREVQSGPQVFWNAAVLPGWQKFKPTYRRGVITALDTDADTANVTLFEPDKSTAQALPINQTPTLANVPVQYMTCHARAFEVGDAVVVKFMGQDWAAPKVVGFVSHPKPCEQQRVWVMISLYDQWLGFMHLTEPRIEDVLVPGAQNAGDVQAKVRGYIDVPISGDYGSGSASVSAATALYMLASKDLNETKATLFHAGASTRTATRTHVENMNSVGDTWNPYDTYSASSYNNTFGKLSGFVGVGGVAVMWSDTLSASMDLDQPNGSALWEDWSATVTAVTDIRWSDGKPAGLRGNKLVTATVSGSTTLVWNTGDPYYGVYYYQSTGGTPSGALVHKPPAFYENAGPARVSLLLNDPAAHFSVPDKYTWQETALKTGATAADANALPYPMPRGGVYTTPFIVVPDPPQVRATYSIRHMDLAAIEYAFMHDGYGSLYRWRWNNKVVGRDWQAYSAQFDPPYDDPALHAGAFISNSGDVLGTFPATYAPVSRNFGFFANGAARSLRYGPPGTDPAAVPALPELDLRLLPDLPADMLEAIENGSVWSADSGFDAISSRAHNTFSLAYGSKQLLVTLVADAKDILGPDEGWDLTNSRVP